MPIFMRIDGIEGDSNAADFKNWFELTSFSWGESNSGGSASGGGGGAGKVTFQDFHFMKRTGKGSPAIMLHCANGKHIPAVQIVITVPRGRREVYLKYTLSDVLITSYAPEGDQGSYPSESISLAFGRFAYDQAVQAGDGSVRYESAFWDLKQNRGG